MEVPLPSQELVDKGTGAHTSQSWTMADRQTRGNPGRRGQWSRAGKITLTQE